LWAKGVLAPFWISQALTYTFYEYIVMYENRTRRHYYLRSVNQEAFKAVSNGLNGACNSLGGPLLIRRQEAPQDFDLTDKVRSKFLGNDGPTME
jgi:hypothetical protein